MDKNKEVVEEESDEELDEDSDEELDEDSDEDETDVIQWEYKGTTYYVDDNDMVYDQNEDEVGKRIKTKSGTYKLRLCKK